MGAIMLTKKQLDLLDFINKRLARDGVPPSFDEMKEHLDLNLPRLKEVEENLSFELPDL